MRRIGRYEVVRELGRGGMGVVLEVRDPALPERRLALKLILERDSPDALARFRREAELLARVRHPHVVRVHALEAAAEGPYLVTDFVEGRPLQQVVFARPLGFEEAARLVRTLADAVATLHAAGILHRDLKPHNVMVRPDGAPVLLDFGLARDLVTQERLTRTGALMGTPAYMAPEQAEGVSPTALGPTVDVYALGGVLLECLTGQPPFEDSDGFLPLLRRVLMDAPRWPSIVRPSVPAGLDAICRVAMAKAPGARYPTAAALRDDLDRFLRDEAPWALGRAGPTRRPAWVGLGALACAAVVVALVLGLAARAATVADPSTRTETASVPPPDPRGVTRPAEEERASRARWEPIVWGQHEDGRVTHALFLDADRVASFSHQDAAVRVRTFSPTLRRQWQDASVPVEVKGARLVRAGEGRLLIGTAGAVWLWDGDAPPRRLIQPGARLDGIEEVAFDPAGDRAVVAGRLLTPRAVSLSRPAPALDLRVRADQRGQIPVGLAVCRGRLLEALRDRNGLGGVLVSTALDAPAPSAAEIPLEGISCLAVHPDAPLAATGVRTAGTFHLVDVSGATPERLRTVTIDALEVMNRGEEVEACVFADGRVWAATSRSVWSWKLEDARLVLESRGERGLGPAERKSLPPDFGGVESIDLSPDGRLLTIGGRDGLVLVRGVDGP